jgi:hypothetical protein
MKLKFYTQRIFPVSYSLQDKQYGFYAVYFIPKSHMRLWTY